MVDKQCLNELALFAGAGGGILGGHLLGWRTVCAVEWEAYPASVLVARQNDGLLPPFPIWDDVQTFDGRPWRGVVDVISGGFPCQDISAAGKGAGIDGERSGMWSHMARVVGEVRPKYVFVENSPMLVNRGLTRVLGDLTALGYDTKWLVMGAADIGANHQRDRIWILGYTNDYGHIASKVRKSVTQRSDCGKTWQDKTSESERPSKQYAELADTRCQLWDEGNSGIVDSQEEIRTSSPILNQPSGEGCGENKMDNANCEGLEGDNNIQKPSSGIQQKPGERCNHVSDSTGIRPQGQREHEQSINSEKGRKGQTIEPVYGRSPDFWAVEPDVGRVAHGVPGRVDRLKQLGNAVVPQIPEMIGRAILEITA